MIDGMNLQTDMPFTSAEMRRSAQSPPSEEKFQFLLFVLDSLAPRKLTVDSAFYSSILVSGALAGGLQKRIASLIARSRRDGNQKEIDCGEIEATGEEELCSVISSWEDLFGNYSSYKEELGPSTVFPQILVSTKNNLGRILACEQAVTYSQNNRRSSQMASRGR